MMQLNCEKNPDCKPWGMKGKDRKRLTATFEGTRSTCFVLDDVILAQVRTYLVQNENQVFVGCLLTEIIFNTGTSRTQGVPGIEDANNNVGRVNRAARLLAPAMR